MKPFGALWEFVSSNGPFQQDRAELEHIFYLMQGAESYLEIGTAEGCSLYVLGHALRHKARITYIDFMEPHTRAMQTEHASELAKSGYFVRGHKGDSTYRPVCECAERADIVLIDGGHDFATVLMDAMNYGPLAKKYIFFHDIQMPSVKQAITYWHERQQLGEYREFINSPNFGYAIIKVNQS